MGDPTTLDRLLQWAGYTPKRFDLEAGQGRCKGNCTKTTSDDLKSVILNYEDVESFISWKYPCLLPHLKETDPGKVMPSTEKSCPPSTFAGVERWIDGRINSFNLTREKWLENHQANLRA